MWSSLARGLMFASIVSVYLGVQELLAWPERPIRNPADAPFE
jgi:hypothetical protein